MKSFIKISCILCIGLLFSCGGGEEKKKDKVQIGNTPVEKKAESPASDLEPASTRITLDNKGVGVVKNIT